MPIEDSGVPGPLKRVSHEGELLALLRDAVVDLGVECVSGRAGAIGSKSTGGTYRDISNFSSATFVSSFPE
jgi:hypothetical protein